MTTRVVLEFEDDNEADRFIDAVMGGYIYNQHDDRPLNETAEVLMAKATRMVGGVWVPLARG